MSSVLILLGLRSLKYTDAANMLGTICPPAMQSLRWESVTVLRLCLIVNKNEIFPGNSDKGLDEFL